MDNTIFLRPIRTKSDIITQSVSHVRANKGNKLKRTKSDNDTLNLLSYPFCHER